MGNDTNELDLVMANNTDDQTGLLKTEGDNFPLFAGYICCFLAVIFFGSNWVPVKKFSTGEGMFFQWIACCGIWFVGVFIHLFQYPNGTFYPVVMIGGVLWCTGNLLTVPIIKTIGLGKGILIWATVNILVGWVTSRFGHWFGLIEKKPANEILNYVGAALCLISSVFYVLIKTTPQQKLEIDDKDVDEKHKEEGTTLMFPDGEVPATGDAVNNAAMNLKPLADEKLVTTSPSQTDTDVIFIEKWSPTRQVIFGVVAAIVAGCVYGCQFLPVDVVQIQNPDASKNGLNYVFAHWTGIFIASTSYFVIYAAYMRNNPRVFPKAILPGLLSGALWAVAGASWFVANATLTPTVSFPIILSGPSMVGALWGVYFKEIRGLRNFLIMGVGFSITITGAILTGLSAL